MVYIKAMRGAMSPLNRVPPEILGRIFALYTASEGGISIAPSHFTKTNPWKLGHVSSYWRDVFWSTPEVWGTIVVPRLEGTDMTWSPNTFAIKNLINIRAMIEYVFFHSGATHSVVVDDHTSSPIADLLAPLSKQIKTLSLNEISPAIFLFFLELPHGSWDCLETLTLTLRDDSNLQPSVKHSSFQLAQNLKDVHIALNLRRLSRTLNMGTFLPPDLLLPWLKLTSLTLVQIPIPWRAAHQILAQCAAMTYCCIPVCRDQSGILTPATITLTRLEFFEVSQDGTIHWSDFLQPFSSIKTYGDNAWSSHTPQSQQDLS